MRAYGSADPVVRRAYAFRGTAKWKRTRLVVLKRDGYRCYWQGPRCLGTADQADHVIPVSHGGAEFDLANLVAACGPCNRARPVDTGGGVHNHAGNGVGFSAGRSALYAPRHSLYTRTDDIHRGVASSRRISHYRAGQSANIAHADSGLVRDYTKAKTAYPPDPVHTQRMRDYGKPDGTG